MTYPHQDPEIRPSAKAAGCGCCKYLGWDGLAMICREPTRAIRFYRMPDGRLSSRDHVSVAFGILHKTRVYEGLEKKLDAVQVAMNMDQEIIRRANDHGIDPNEVRYRAPEKNAEESTGS